MRRPVRDGLEATQRNAASGSPARVIVLTTFEADEYVLEAVRAGASGCLLKAVSAHDPRPIRRQVGVTVSPVRAAWDTAARLRA